MLEIMALLVCLPFVLGLPFVAISYLFFWYETQNGSHLARLMELSGGHPGRWVLRGVLSGMVAVGIVIVSFPFGWLRRRNTPIILGGDRPPVLLVHGLYHNPGAWLLYQGWLRRAGYRHVETLGYSSLGRSFEELAGNLSRAIDELASSAGRPVVVIGHSLGGLLARVCAQQRDTRERVAALVTLGTPHQGSKLAAVAFGRLGRSLLYRRELVDRIERGSLPDSLPRLAVVSPVDNMVLPNEALRVRKEGWAYCETGPISHVSLLYHSPTAKRVIAFLDEALGETRSSSTQSAGQ